MYKLGHCIQLVHVQYFQYSIMLILYHCSVRFRSSTSKSRIDRFPIFSSATSVIMPPRRAYRRNVNGRNANAAPLSPY
uniref:Uncharacterized protein n=1 Tax=Solanum tuberosum TaxID=4113 RepID=M1DFS2_SOLTU